MKSKCCHCYYKYDVGQNITVSCPACQKPNPIDNGIEERFQALERDNMFVNVVLGVIIVAIITLFCTINDV
jgi:hypothetical protein